MEVTTFFSKSRLINNKFQLSEPKVEIIISFFKYRFLTRGTHEWSFVSRRLFCANKILLKSIYYLPFYLIIIWKSLKPTATASALAPTIRLFTKTTYNSFVYPTGLSLRCYVAKYDQRLTAVTPSFSVHCGWPWWVFPSRYKLVFKQHMIHDILRWQQYPSDSLHPVCANLEHLKAACRTFSVIISQIGQYEESSWPKK